MDVSNWVQGALIIEVIRSMAGPDRAAGTVNFRADYWKWDEARETFANSRLVAGAPSAAFLFPGNVLSHCDGPKVATRQQRQTEHPEISELDDIRAVLRPDPDGESFQIVRPPRCSKPAIVLGRDAYVCMGPPAVS